MVAVVVVGIDLERQSFGGMVKGSVNCKGTLIVVAIGVGIESIVTGDMAK